ncbi:DUF397 domain-containing protein [Nocardiopsis sp. CNR-923]|uniref:DUF397 domain-containing protein n=1 Tax=Nocardiopsis sp. CNR-923 TaxID=1904965 RepID=UPI0009F97FF8|nr:DUF397 domain-containing protein [Nocardiopsis sp. CNR-923]
MTPSTNPALRTSSHSARSNCVEVADLPGSPVGRDSHDDLGHLEVSPPHGAP